MTAIGQSDLLQALGWAVFNSMWQMAILWVAYQLIVSVFRIKQSANKSSLAVLMLFAGFAWFCYTLLSGLTAGQASFSGVMSINTDTGLEGWMGTTLPLASILYLVLLIFPVLNFIRNYRYVQVIRRFGLSRADVQWRMFVQKIAVRMDIRKPVYIWMSELVSSPVTIGYLKPVILLPIAAINHLSPQQIEAVLLHELSHIKRYDYFINLLTKLIQTLLYFNPFVKAFVKIFETEREKSCDETVMQFQYEPHGYASALLVLEKAAHIPHHSLAVGASDGKKSEFRKRIEWILGVPNKQTFSFNKLAGVLAALLCFIGLNAFIILSSQSSKKLEQKGSYSYISSPYDLFADRYDGPANASPASSERRNPSIVTGASFSPQELAKSAIEQKEKECTEEEKAEPASPVQENMISALTFVNNIQNLIPKLDPLKEQQVQEAMDEAKKVIKETQWKEVEKSIADALTRVEKDKLKEVYETAINKIDWNTLGDKLRIAYDKIDWPVINYQLDNAIAAIKMDSLQQVYTVAIENISNLQSELVKENQAGIPDSDINIKSLEIKKDELQKGIDRIRKMKPKEVIHL
jgi:bla regulator protein BlaR1